MARHFSLAYVPMNSAENNMKKKRPTLIDSESILKDSNSELSNCRDSHIRTKNTYKLTKKKNDQNKKSTSLNVMHSVSDCYIRDMHMKIASSSDL